MYLASERLVQMFITVRYVVQAYYVLLLAKQTNAHLENKEIYRTSLSPYTEKYRRWEGIASLSLFNQIL